MSLSDEERRIMVEHELNKAHKTMEQVYVLATNEFWDGAANRLYYAAFHAVCALLIYDGISVHTHHGVNSMLYMQYVKTGKLSAGLAKLFSSLQTMREKSDYNCSFNGLPEGEDASFFLCKELKTGYLDGIKGEYATPQGYFVDETEAEEFDKLFPIKEKKVLPGQLF